MEKERTTTTKVEKVTLNAEELSRYVGQAGAKVAVKLDKNNSDAEFHFILAMLTADIGVELVRILFEK